MDFGDYMRALDRMPAVAGHPCDKCFGLGVVAVRCCDGRECGCYGMAVDYTPCDCGTPTPTDEQIQKYVPEGDSR